MDRHEAVQMWDLEAPRFDEAADHGLSDPDVRAAWRDLLLDVLPAAPARIADMGCGTGTLTELLADEGFTVDGIDFSPRMVQLAQRKTLGRRNITIAEADATASPLPAAAYEVVLRSITCCGLSRTRRQHCGTGCTCCAPPVDSSSSKGAGRPGPV